MAKYCVQANLTFDTKAKRDKLHAELLTKLAYKPTWGEVFIGASPSTPLSVSTDEDNRPAQSLLVRYNYRADMNAMYEFIKDKMAKIPLLSGSVSRHVCGHDEGSPWNCRDDPKAEYEEFVR